MARKNKAERAPRPRMPDNFRQQAVEAIERHRQRGWVPDVIQGSKSWVCPYADEDRNLWEALLFEIFGTRQTSVLNAFVSQLSEIGPQVHRKGHAHTPGRWELGEAEMNQMLAIMLALKPQDEAQAAFAVQAVALHLSAMKLATITGRTYGGDPKTATVLNKTVNAYGTALERMAKLQGKLQPRAVHQTIEVTYNDNRQQAVVYQGGGGQYGDQPQGTDGSAAIQCPSLPSSNQGGAALSLPCGEGQAGVPVAWWGQRLWRAFRLAQR